MESAVSRIEALPGEGRYAVTFQRPDGSEQTAIAQVTQAAVEVAEASLPIGWTRDSRLFRATADAVSAFDAARRLTATAATLRDVDGGWDVSLGNVVLGEAGEPTCTAHGEMPAGTDGVFVCAECGARAVVS